jgi:hypothetical protein
MSIVIIQKVCAMLIMNTVGLVDHLETTRVGLRIFNKISHKISGRPGCLKKLHKWLCQHPFYSLDEFMALRNCDISFLLIVLPVLYLELLFYFDTLLTIFKIQILVHLN